MRQGTADGEGAMTSVSEPTPAPTRRWRSDPITRLVSMTPFALAFYFDFLYRPVFGGPMFSKPPEALGLPLGIWLQIAFLSWAGVGAWVVWTTHSPWKSAIALVLCTPLAIVGLVFGPAIVLILQNLGS
jgi:hypothetical protein